MTILTLTEAIEAFAPLPLQESYDNAGLIVGRPESEVTAALLCVDITEAVVAEAVRRGAGLVIAHHPILFHPVKRLNGTGYIERTVEMAIREGVALYAAHTNLDSAPEGLSRLLGRQLGLRGMEVLAPSRTEVPGAGFGVVGELPQPMPLMAYLARVRERLSVQAIRYSRPATEQVQRIALCTGSGGSLMGQARASRAQLYLAADFRYNDFLDADRDLTIADIGHYESEFCAIELLHTLLSEKFPNFALYRSADAHNPVNYLT